MNSAFLESVQGFLNSRSVSHSVERWAKVGVTPLSSSSQFSIGVTSTATVGPMLDPPSFRFQPGATPSSTTAAGSFSTGCERAFTQHRNQDAIKTDRFVLTMPSQCLHRIVFAFGPALPHSAAGAVAFAAASLTAPFVLAGAVYFFADDFCCAALTAAHRFFVAATI